MTSLQSLSGYLSYQSGGRKFTLLIPIELKVRNIHQVLCSVSSPPASISLVVRAGRTQLSTALLQVT